MKVLVTGAGGFIGKHVIKLLEEKRNQVFGTFFSPTTFHGIAAHPNMFEYDLRDFETIKSIV